MSTYQVAYNATTKVVKVQPTGSTLGTGFTNKGTFDHDNDPDDQLGDEVSHVIFQHVRDLLYKAGVLDMASVKITIPAITVTTLPVTKSLDLSLGQTQILENTVAPANARATLSYVSSDPTKATVDANGKITPKAVGSTTVTVTANPGGATDTCVVTVVA